jgi:hypothetical protein
VELTPPVEEPQTLARLLRAEGMPRARRIGLGLASIAIAAAIWLPLVHLFFRPGPRDFQPPAGISPFARALAARHLELWTRPDLREAELRRMRATNAEWDFMGRTFLVLALANMSLRAPDEAPRDLEVIDAIIAETIRLERERGARWFLMDYARGGDFRSGVDRSLFVDGEVALMIGARRLVAERADLAPLMRERVDALLAYMGAAPALCGESYPDECWMFCNAVALAALRLDEALGGPDHGAFIARWLERARARLVDARTGLLVSSFTYGGEPLDGPEGSSIFMVAHCLALVDPAFARDQWERARRELFREALGFGWAAEWPASWRGALDVDSGPVVPLLDVSAGASGMAFLGAATFGDRAALDALATTLRFAAFPTWRGEALRFCASNQVGDAVLLYSAVMGPLWEKVEHGRQR